MTATKPVEIVDAMFNHRYSFPSSRCQDKEAEINMAYSPSIPPHAIKYCHCSLSTWAAQVIGNRVYREIKNLVFYSPDPDDSDCPPIPAQLLASANDRTRAKGALVLTKDDLLSFRIADRVTLFKRKARLCWYLTECMAAPRKRNGLIVRIRRPTSIIQVAAISSFVLARNQYANGFMALQMGIFHVACQSHVDVKRFYCLMAASTHDTTTRRALATVAEHSLGTLRTQVNESADSGQVSHRYILDNIQ
ncbi:hypothetical protein K435DRAFT_706323, partial [Dendrothele bispora CBS 962.96]